MVLSSSQVASLLGAKSNDSLFVQDTLTAVVDIGIQHLGQSQYQTWSFENDLCASTYRHLVGSDGDGIQADHSTDGQ